MRCQWMLLILFEQMTGRVVLCFFLIMAWQGFVWLSSWILVKVWCGCKLDEGLSKWSGVEQRFVSVLIMAWTVYILACSSSCNLLLHLWLGHETCVDQVLVLVRQLDLMLDSRLVYLNLMNWCGLLWCYWFDWLQQLLLCVETGKNIIVRSDEALKFCLWAFGR